VESIDKGRRRFISGRGAPPTDRYLISSAVVSAFPERAQAVAQTIAALPGVEVRAVHGGKIVILLEGRESGAIGARLAEIALMDGVLAANLVYEHAEAERSGEGDGADAT
jgi:nitrate reductase NapD